MSGFCAFLLWFVAWPFTWMWRSYVVIILWGWFVTPVMSIPAPSIYVLTGLMMTLFVILPFQRATKKEGEDPFQATLNSFLVYGLAAPAIMLGCGWVWKWLQWGVA